MLTGLIIMVVLILFLVVFAVYKRDMVTKMFSLRVDDQANLFQEQLEQTADKVISRLEEQITHLELLLEEADNKIVLLNDRIQAADESLKRAGQFAVVDLEAGRGDGLVQEKDVSYYEVSDADAAADTTVSPKTELFSHDKKQLIMAMADQGYSVTEIAKATGLGKGEIMLLLQLNKR